MNVAEFRQACLAAALDASTVDRDPLAQYQRWLDEATRAEIAEPIAAALATATRDGAPSVRIVLVKGADARGFRFFTDYRSRKGRELEENPRAALCHNWYEIGRQVRIEGAVKVLSHAENREYYRTRPLGSRIGAWASTQSTPIASRSDLEARIAALARELGPDPELPPHWGGYMLEPVAIEFWQARENRLHDRIEYRQRPDGWRSQRLSP